MLRLFVKQDLDGFFGLAIDNLIQLLLIVVLCSDICGMPASLVYGKILPAAAVSVLFGNFYYAWQAHRLSKKENRSDVCALPYGINTVSLFGFIFFVILPVYQHSHDAHLAWRVGVLACFLNALIEIVVSFFGAWIRRVTPRAALLSSLAGIAITFISMDFAFKTFAKPLLAFVPLFIILITYFAKRRLPWGIPGGFYAVVMGSILAWLSGSMSLDKVSQALSTVGFYFPSLALGDLGSVFTSHYFYSYLSIIIPMALFNVIGSLQNIESAAAAGDSYPTRPCLLANGFGSIVASILGSPFPTTIYIGHPGWKGLGARAGYSVLNGIFVTLICFFGAVNLISTIMPLEAGIAIVLWIGIIIMAQAYQATPRQHAPAVAIGIIPALAAWALMIIQGTLSYVGRDLESIGVNNFIQTYSVGGILSLSQGFIFTSMIWASLSVFLIEGEFRQAFYWALAAAALSFFGVIHTFVLQGNDVLNHFGLGVGLPFSLSYLAGACLFGLAWFFKPYPPTPSSR